MQRIILVGFVQGEGFGVVTQHGLNRSRSFVRRSGGVSHEAQRKFREVANALVAAKQHGSGVFGSVRRLFRAANIGQHASIISPG